ncbi:VOC family protein [Noviherbaspirillum sp. 1P10PC]|uniref:VOC family protein n=1 Tax=Noviherbaspirillum sp. 1P10PC TaxID=3132292 RepID=UPI00399FC0DD
MQSIATNFWNVSPLIPARDVEEGIAFYRNALGFELTYRDADPAQFAILGCNGVRLHLFDNQDKNLADWTSLRIVVERIDTLYRRCQENGCVHPNGLLGSRPWGNTGIFDHRPDGGMYCIRTAGHNGKLSGEKGKVE